jgi:hypothetical protein
MSEYTRIAKSKRLRYKIIQLMYLIFLILSVIQIPSDWISVNGYINKYIERPAADYSDPVLEQAANEIDAFEILYLENVLLDNKTKQIKEPNSFTKSDNFLIEKNNGKILFDVIVKLNNWSKKLEKQDKRRIEFEKLFKLDLENGVLMGNEKAWIKWRWKNVPAIIANNFIKELKLRILLINKNVFKELETPKPLISFKSNISQILVNQEVYLSLKGDSIKTIKIFNNNIESFDYKIIGIDSIIFKPTVSGNYTLNINSVFNSEEILFEVNPAFFKRKESVPLRLCFNGVDYNLEIESNHTDGVLWVEGDPNARYNSEKNEIKFNINQEGWNEIKLTSKKGLIFHDSVFVKSIPTPRVTIDELPSFSINKQRLKTLKSLNLIASHPSIYNGIYKVDSYKVRWVNSNPLEETILGSKVEISEKNTETLKYIIIHSINIKMGSKIKSLEQTIIIPVL